MIAVVSAGLSLPSSSKLLADRLAEAAGAATGLEAVHIELRDLAVAVAGNLVTGFPAPDLATALETVTAADALIAVTPIFNGSYNGLFKSFFDVLDRDALDGKPVLLGATGGTARHSMALDFAIRPMFAHLRARTVPTAVFAAPEDWGDGESLAPRVTRAAEELAALLQGAPPAPKPVFSTFEAELAKLKG
ncbi:CE1759 family FMN reductase [Actinocorallia longicatena]|uniref:FMN reductase n=1 Tax=Actinocorallia longicatena TaxID=111803 RepID=A0ABP6QAU0_9ACTN